MSMVFWCSMIPRLAPTTIISEMAVSFQLQPESLLVSHEVEGVDEPNANCSVNSFPLKPHLCKHLNLRPSKVNKENFSVMISSTAELTGFF